MNLFGCIEVFPGLRRALRASGDASQHHLAAEPPPDARGASWLRRTLRGEGGFILPFVLVVALVGIFVALPVVVLSGSNFRGHVIVEDRTRDYYAADANIHAIIEDLKRGADLAPVSPNVYTPSLIDFGEIVPSAAVRLLESELLATVRPIDFAVVGNPTVLTGFSPRGTGLDLLNDDDSYYELTDAGTPPSLEWEITSDVIDFPNVSFGSVDITALSTKSFTKLEIYVFNPDDPEHTEGGYSPVPDLTEILNLALVEERTFIFLEDADIAFLNSLSTKTLKVKIRATRSGGFKLFTDRLIFSMSGVVSTDERKVQDEPFINVGTLSAGSGSDLDVDDVAYYKVSSWSTGEGSVVEFEVTSNPFAFSPVNAVDATYVTRSNKSGITLEMYVFNPNGTGHGVDGYDTVPDLTTIIPLNNTDKPVRLIFPEEDVDYLNTLFPKSAKIKVKAIHTSAFQLESDLLIFIATSPDPESGSVIVPQVIQQYIDPGLENPDFATIATKEGYLMRIWGVHAGLMSVSWAYHTPDFSQAKASLTVFRGLVSDGGVVVPPGNITSKPPTRDNELVVSKRTRAQEAFVHTGFFDVDKGLYTLVFFNDSPSTLIAEPFAARGETGDTWIYAAAFKDYLVDILVGTVAIKAVLRQVPGPTEPPAFPWSTSSIGWIENQVYVQSWEPYGVDPLAIPTPTPVPAPITVATEDWESGGLAGGTGWLAAWSAQGGANAVATTLDNPFAGLFHLRLQSSDGYVSRSLDLLNHTSVRLQIRARVSSFESGDTADVLGSPDGINWTVINTFTNIDSDNIYTLWDFDLSAFEPFSQQFFIAFDANMNSTGDQMFIDDVEIIGQPP